MTEEKKTVTIQIYRYDVPRINITYKNRKDLFKSFVKELKKHHLSIGEVSWADYDNGDRSVIRNANDLFGAVADCNSVKMYCRPTGDTLLFTPPNSDDDEDEPGTLPTSSDETKTASIKLFRDNLPRITITYRSKKDLFRKFQKKIEELNLPTGEVYFFDYYDGERSVVKNADDLFEAVENNAIVKLYYRRTGGNELLTCCSSDEDEEEDTEKGPSAENDSQNRSTSPSGRRHRLGSSFIHSHNHPTYEQMLRNFARWNFMMDPRFTPVAFPHSSEENRRRKRERCHRCCCEDLSNDLSYL